RPCADSPQTRIETSRDARRLVPTGSRITRLPDRSDPCDRATCTISFGRPYPARAILAASFHPLAGYPVSTVPYVSSRIAVSAKTRSRSSTNWPSFDVTNRYPDGETVLLADKAADCPRTSDS